MAEILIYLATQLPFLFAPDGFRFVDSAVGRSFGGDAAVLLESPTLRLRVTWDRAQLLMEFQPLNGKRSEWFSPGLLRGVLIGERSTSEVLDEDWARFLTSALPDLEERLQDPETAKQTLSDLREQAKLRSAELFG